MSCPSSRPSPPGCTPAPRCAAASACCRARSAGRTCRPRRAAADLRDHRRQPLVHAVDLRRRCRPARRLPFMSSVRQVAFGDFAHAAHQMLQRAGEAQVEREREVDEPHAGGDDGHLGPQRRRCVGARSVSVSTSWSDSSRWTASAAPIEAVAWSNRCRGVGQASALNIWSPVASCVDASRAAGQPAGAARPARCMRGQPVIDFGEFAADCARPARARRPLGAAGVAARQQRRALSAHDRLRLQPRDRDLISRSIMKWLAGWRRTAVPTLGDPTAPAG